MYNSCYIIGQKKHKNIQSQKQTHTVGQNSGEKQITGQN